VALNNLGMGFLFTARDLASGVMRRIGMGLRRLGGSGRAAGAAISAGLGVAAAGAITLAAGVGTLMGAWSAARAAGQFEQTMARVGALARASAADLDRLTEAAIQAGIETQFSPTEAAEGLAELAVRGFQTQEAIDALQGTLDLAAGGQISVAQSSATLGAALRAFSLNADQAGITTDQLLRISNVTALQANELELALGNVARGAGVARQSIEEMLPAIGLVRNTGVQASVAASSVSSALLFMARRASQFDQVLGRTNSLVDESTGQFRDFMDVVLETSTALESQYTNQTDRARVATELFGRFGLTAFSAISRQLTNGIRNAEGQIVRGAEAINFLRKSMRGAEGAAAEFRERLLNTFQGQVILLRGTMQTLATVVGGPFGQAFMPILALVRHAANATIRFFRAIPESGRRAIAILIMIGGVFATGAGAATLLGLAVAILIPFLKVMLITLAVLAVALGGFIIGITAVVAALGALYVAYRRNIGGFGDYVRAQVQRIQIIWSTLVDLFTHGGVREGSKILAPQNRGLLQFALNVYAIGRRLMAFFRGVRKGFDEGFQRVLPAVNAMLDALRDLGRAFGFLSDEQSRSLVTANSMEDFMSTGARLGSELARGIGMVANAIGVVADVWRGFVEGWDVFMQMAGPGIELLIGPLQEMWTQLSSIITPMGELLGLTTHNRDGSASFGEVLAGIAGFLVGGFASALGVIVRVFMLVVNAIRLVVLGFRSLWAAGEVVIEALSAGFQNMADGIMVALGRLVEFLGSIAQRIPPGLRPRQLDDLIRAGQQMGVDARQRQARIQERAAGVQAFGMERFGPESELSQASEQLMRDFGRTFTAGVEESMAAYRPAVAEREPSPTDAEAATRARSGGGGGGEAVASAVERLAREQRRTNEQPIVIQVVVDGEVVDEQRRTRGEAAGRQVGTGG
jgi:TP901 family phage tail tape measure protein